MYQIELINCEPTLDETYSYFSFAKVSGFSIAKEQLLQGFVQFSLELKSEQSAFCKIHLARLDSSTAIAVGEVPANQLVVIKKNILISSQVEKLVFHIYSDTNRFSIDKIDIRSASKIKFVIETVKIRFPNLKRFDLKPVWRDILFDTYKDTKKYPAIFPIDAVDTRSDPVIKLPEASKDTDLLISILTPIYNTNRKDLLACVKSVQRQTYPNWELCLVDDASTSKETLLAIEEIKSFNDTRIKIRQNATNEHIAISSNYALTMATGEFIATLDHDDLLSPDALEQVVNVICKFPDIDFIYSDEDKMDMNGSHCDPYFKPDWSPELFLGQMYTAHLAVYRKAIIEKIGGYRKGYDGAQDWDLVLRLTEVTDKIYHIPKILYTWRQSPTSTALSSKSKDYASIAAQNAIQDALKRRRQNAEVIPVENYPGQFFVKFHPEDTPKVSIIICTKDNYQFLRKCVESIFAITSYANYEVIVVSNNTSDLTKLQFLDDLKVNYAGKLKWYQNNIPFNFSALNNHAAKIATGDYLLLLNDDTEVITSNWLELMLGYAQLPKVFAVGALLLYPDNTIQHGGVILGINKWAGHAFRGSSINSPGYAGRLLISHNVSAVTGACLMVNKEKFINLGGLDENLAVACNDVEICLRALESGFRNVMLPQVRLSHFESVSRGDDSSSPVKYGRYLREVGYVWQKWGNYMGNDPYFPPAFSRDSENYQIKPGI